MYIYYKKLFCMKFSIMYFIQLSIIVFEPKLDCKIQSSHFDLELFQLYIYPENENSMNLFLFTDLG